MPRESHDLPSRPDLLADYSSLQYSLRATLTPAPTSSETDSTTVISRPTHGNDREWKYVEPLITRNRPCRSSSDSMSPISTATPRAMRSGRGMSGYTVDSRNARLKNTAATANAQIA